ncbi:unnamed protein product [Caenorhabditis bovis]|uniref:Uncharacterized protein n=1 Tax=Caenorhabditis bovis TaxID=2654633 RepID=A0A8S1ESE7_9PELO|nr:unnamed protein product [Caenorhabditis bovis]
MIMHLTSDLMLEENHHEYQSTVLDPLIEDQMSTGDPIADDNPCSAEEQSPMMELILVVHLVASDVRKVIENPILVLGPLIEYQMSTGDPVADDVPCSAEEQPPMMELILVVHLVASDVRKVIENPILVLGPLIEYQMSTGDPVADDVPCSAEEQPPMMELILVVHLVASDVRKVIENPILVLGPLIEYQMSTGDPVADDVPCSGEEQPPMMELILVVHLVASDVRKVIENPILVLGPLIEYQMSTGDPVADDVPCSAEEQPPMMELILVVHLVASDVRKVIENPILVLGPLIEYQMSTGDPVADDVPCSGEEQPPMMELILVVHLVASDVRKISTGDPVADDVPCSAEEQPPMMELILVVHLVASDVRKVIENPILVLGPLIEDQMSTGDPVADDVPCSG